MDTDTPHRIGHTGQAALYLGPLYEPLRDAPCCCTVVGGVRPAECCAAGFSDLEVGPFNWILQYPCPPSRGRPPPAADSGSAPQPLGIPNRTLRPPLRPPPPDPSLHASPRHEPLRSERHLAGRVFVPTTCARNHGRGHPGKFIGRRSRSEAAAGDEPRAVHSACVPLRKVRTRQLFSGKLPTQCSSVHVASAGTGTCRLTTVRIVLTGASVL